MANMDISELEAAARVFMDPAFVAPDDRQKAEKIIVEFRKTPSPYILCRYILDHSHVDMLLFEAADVLKRAIVLEWDSLQEQDRMDVRQYLLNLVLQRQLIPYVREKILQVIAIMIKRKSVGDGSQETRIILEEMNKLMNMAPAQQKLLICRVLAAILQEYLITVKSDDKGLTFSDHFKVKKTFEIVHLRKIFEMTFTTLDNLLQNLNLEDRVQALLTHELITILEQILMWGYVSPLLPKRLIGLFEGLTKTDQAPSLRLNTNWEPVLVKPRILEVFFTLYWKVREVPELQRITLTCIVQLSTLNGTVFPNTHARQEYVANFLTKFLQLLMSTQVKQCEAVAVATTFRKMLLYHANVPMPPNLIEIMLKQMDQLTISFAENAVREENIGTEDSAYNEALEKMLEAWLLILQNKDVFPRDVIRAYASNIFLKYVQCHLAPPDGLRTGTESFEEESDREKYKEQLIIIGSLARENIKESLAALNGICENRIQRLGAHLGEMLRYRNRLNMSITKAMDDLFDDIHWLLLIAGHAITMDAAGEQPLIPMDILLHSYDESRNGTVDIGTTLSVLAAPNQSITQTPNGDVACDGLVRLITSVFRLCDVENNAFNCGMKEFLSPEVSSDIMWFLTNWAEPYLFMQTEYYSVRSQPLESAFGTETPGGTWTLNFLLNKVCENVKNYPTEVNVVKDSIKLFVSLVKRKHKCHTVFASAHFKQIVELRKVPVRSSDLITGLVLTASCITDKELQQQYLTEILVPIRETFNKLEWNDVVDTRHSQGKAQISTKVVALLEDIRAAQDGASAICAQHVFNIFEPILCHLASLLDMFHNYNNVLVEVFQVLISVVQNLTFLQPTKVYDICLSCMRSYVKHNGNRMAAILNNDPTAEEEGLEDLMLLLNLINSLLSKNYFDVDEDEDEQALHKEKSTEVCIFGFQYIMGLMTMDMLRYPDLCCKYYQTLTFFVDTKSHRVCSLEPQLFTSMLQSVQLGLQAFGMEVQSHCLEFLQLVANAVRLDKNEQTYVYSALLPFLRVILEMILNQNISSDNRNECAHALFALIYCYPSQYAVIVQELLQLLPNAEHVERLSKEFNLLIDRLNLQGTIERLGQNQFIDRYEKFTINIAFLFD